MSQTTFTAPRRSGRVFHKMRVQANGRGHDGRKFREVCQTLVVNSHGGLLLVKNEIASGGEIVLTNPDTEEEQELPGGVVVSLAMRGNGSGWSF